MSIVPVRWPIRWQILVPSAATMALALCGVSLLNAYIAAQSVERRIEQQLRDIAHTLHDATFPLTETVLRQMRGLSGADFLITDESGQVAVASRMLTPRIDTATVREDWRELQLKSTSAAGLKNHYQMALRLNDRLPRTTPGTSSRILHILYPADELGHARRQAMWPSLLVGSTALLAVVVLALAIAHRISHPIYQLRRDVRRLAEADFRPVRLPPRNDELRDLAVDINHLAGELNELRNTIRQTERLILLGQLSGGLAHHLRNDVTGARMAIQLHQRDCSTADPEALAVALRQLNLAEEHLRRFLATGAPRPLQLARHDLQSIVHESLSLIQPALKHRQIDLQSDLPLKPILIDADGEQLRSALLNLVFNAADAVGPLGWIRVQVQVDPCYPRAGTSRPTTPTSHQSPPAHATIIVSDSGPGPAIDIEPRMFEPFTTTKPEGAGLGLSVSRVLIEAHGGTLTFERRSGIACFKLTVPLATLASSAPPPSDPQFSASPSPDDPTPHYHTDNPVRQSFT